MIRALLRHPAGSICRYRRAAGHHVREVAGAGPVPPIPVQFCSAMPAAFAETIQGPEMMRLFQGSSLKCRLCCRKTCLTSIKERDNAWLRELIGRLSMARGGRSITRARWEAIAEFLERLRRSGVAAHAS